MAYWPCLLDRLTDNKPSQKAEGETDRRISKDAYLAIVVRDLNALLNASSLPERLYSTKHISGHDRLAERMNFKFGFDPDAFEAAGDARIPKLEDFPRTEASTLNYGFYDLNGASVGNITMARLEKFILATIQRFEPRVRSVQVAARRAEDAKTPGEREEIEKRLAHSILTFEIRCKIELDGMPHDLRMKNDLDLKTGHWTPS